MVTKFSTYIKNKYQAYLLQQLINIITTQSDARKLDRLLQKQKYRDVINSITTQGVEKTCLLNITLKQGGDFGRTHGFYKKLVFDFLETLLKHGANPNLYPDGTRNSSPITTAVNLRADEAIKLLLQNGGNMANIDYVNAKNILLDIANPRLMDFLFTEGLDPNISGSDPVHGFFATKPLIFNLIYRLDASEILNMIDVFIKHNANLEITDEHGVSFLARLSDRKYLQKHYYKDLDTSVIIAKCEKHLISKSNQPFQDKLKVKKI